MWTPKLSETHVFRSTADESKAVLIIVPESEEIPSVALDGVSYELDTEMTAKTRLYIRVHQSNLEE